MTNEIRKLITIKIILIIIVFSLISIISVKILEDHLIEEENTRIKEEIQILNRLLDYEVSRQESTAKDWSEWDDTYNYVRGMNKEYEEANLYDETLENLNLEFMIFKGKENNLVNLFYITDEYIAREIFEETLRIEKTKTLTKYIIINNKIYLVTLSPITPSQNTTEIGGTLILGKEISEQKLKEISAMLGKEVTLKIEEQETEISINRTKTEIKTNIRKETLNNRKIAFTIREKRLAYNQGKKALYILLIILWTVAIVFILLLIYLNKKILNKLILPITKIKEQAKKIKKGEIKRIQIQEDKDLKEISEIINYFNKESEEKKENLEHEIKKRTNELNKKIKDLDQNKKALLNMMEDINEANEDLIKLDKAKSEFLNIVSHELKTPLTAMMAYLEILEDSENKLKGDELESLNALKRNANSLKTLIGNILEIARMESGKFDLAKEKTDIQDLIEETLSDIEILAKQKKLNLKKEIEKLPKINVDKERIKEVINNLVSNAIKFTEKGEIKVTAKKENKTIKIIVSDTGVGIPEEHIKDLFHAFYQVDASISRKYGGTGLGLTITKKIIEAHGGKISVESKENKGTTFTITIPIK